MLGNGEGRCYEMCSATRLQLYGSVEGVYRDVLYSIVRVVMVVMVMGGSTKCGTKYGSVEGVYSRAGEL